MTIGQFRAIKHDLKVYQTQKDVAEGNNVSVTTVGRVKRSRSFKAYRELIART